jgi:hypothetical protein
MRRTLLTLCSTLALAGTATAQAEPLDQGTLSIRIADVEVAREQFTLIQGRRGGLPGSTVRAVASYPAARPRHRYTGILERTGPQTLAAFQVELAGDPPGRTVAELSRNRLTVRSAAPERESAQEFPGGPDLVALDDSVYTFWLAITDLASEEGTALRYIFPRSGERGAFTARRERVADAPASIVLSGGIEGRILLDEAGRFQGLLLPARKIEVLRLPE